MAGTRRWRWRDVPLPEAHLALVAAGVILGLRWPRRITSARSVRLLGGQLIVVEVVWAAWATRTAGRVDLERPERLVTRGPSSGSATAETSTDHADRLHHKTARSVPGLPAYAPHQKRKWYTAGRVPCCRLGGAHVAPAGGLESLGSLVSASGCGWPLPRCSGWCGQQRKTFAW